MDNAGYTTLTRQAGLLAEMQTVANNIANMSTTGFRKQGILFSEHISAIDSTGGSLSMASADVRTTNSRQGALSQTKATFDFAIEGNGYFLIETPRGQRLTRAGAFTPNDAGELVNPEGFRLLDAGKTPVFVPPDAKSLSLATDGTLSADGNPVAQIGLYTPRDSNSLTREAGVMFRTDKGIEPAENARILQGFLEDSNVNPIAEISRMIEVQRAYELGQHFLDKEDERIRGVIQTLGR